MQKRVTLREIAERVGISVNTVSNALRGTGRVSPETRQRVRKAAEELDYRPDPALSALVAYRSEKQQHTFQGKLAILMALEEYYWKLSPYYSGAIYGFQERAQKLGYKTEIFYASDYPAHRLEHILYHQGIKGILIGAMQNFKLSIRLDRFPVVKLGRSGSPENVDRVSHDHSWGMYHTLEQLVKRGYRRIAFFIQPDMDKRTDRQWSSTFLYTCVHMPLGKQLEHFMFFFTARINDKLDDLKNHRIDAVIHINDWSIEGLKNAFNVPEEVAYVSLSKARSANYAEVAGIDQLPEQNGEKAAEILDMKIRTNQTGCTEYPIILLIPGKWVDADSMPYLSHQAL